MLIGIISDSHGDADATRRAIALLRRSGAELFIHCGDVCGDAVLDELAACGARFVWGNCDNPSPILRAYVRTVGLAWPDVPIRVEAGRKSIAVYHGHEAGFHAALASPDTDYLLYGHTHRCDDRRVGRCRIINPGALYRAKVRTVALLDPESDRLEFIPLSAGDSARDSGADLRGAVRSRR